MKENSKNFSGSVLKFSSLWMTMITEARPFRLDHWKVNLSIARKLMVKKVAKAHNHV